MLFVHLPQPHSWSTDELTLIAETAERTWAAVERAKAEAALRDSKTLLSDILEASPIGLGLTNQKGDLVVANTVLYRFLPTGRMPSKDPDTRWRWTAFNPDGSPVEPYNWPGARAARGEVVVPGLDMRYIQEDGTERWTQVSAVPNKDAEGTVVGHVVSVTDITERAKAEAALRLSEAKFRRISESGIVAVAYFDIGGPIVDANDAFLELLGVTREELQTDKVRWDVYTVPEWLPRTRQAIDEFKQTGSIQPFEKQFYHTSGAVKWGIFAGATLGDGQTGVSLVVDITNRRQAEEALKQADQRKDEFLAMLAHELRNPLTPVRNGLQLLAQVPTQDQLLGTLLPIMNRQMDHVMRMMDDLLDVSRISRGKIELHTQRTDLSQVVAQTHEAMRPLYTQAGRQLTAQLPDYPLYLDGDATRLHQVVTNLLTNGLRYTLEGGQVWLSIEEDGQQALLRVRDNGVGLAADQLEAIFELFVQVDHSLARSQGGLGLGLSLVQQLVHLHGGRVEAHSPGLGQGSEFVVTLPLLIP